MKTKHWLWLLSLGALSAGCTEPEPVAPDPNKCDPRCQWGTTCIKGVCIDNSMVCKPECEPGFACWENQCIEEHLACKAPCDEGLGCFKGECIEISKICSPECDTAAGYECWNQECKLSSDICREGCGTDLTCVKGECLPEDRICRHKECDENNEDCTERLEGCASDEICHQGACTKTSKICNPECNAVTQACIDNVCVYQEDYCAKGTCSEDLTQYCNVDAGEYPKFAKCDENFGCIEGKCVLKSEFECAPKSCVNNKTACPQGKKIACHSKYEYCDADPASPTVGQCIVDTTVTCKPDVCIDGVDNFVCNDKAQPVKCPDNQRCQDGRCIQAVTEEARDIWKVCLDTSECGTGETCIKRMPLDGENFYLYEMSTRDSIDAGEGVCSADCTRDSSVCDGLEGDWSCMLLRGGTNPYKLGATESLLSAGLDYAAICRPHMDPETTGWQSDFCAVCNEDNPCADPYVCYDGQCVTPCRDDSHCPLFFECKDNTDLKLKICQPQASKSKDSVGSYCHACYDTDGDGFGIGNCANTGIDCNDTDNTVHYREFLYPSKHNTEIKNAIGEAPACTKNDWNCNGVTDQEEILGSLSYCSSCDEGSACVPVAQECNSGKCQYVDDYCEPGSCSADGSHYCPQSSLAEWEACGDGYSCTNGQCELTIWDICNSDSDCTGTLKTCVKKVLVQGAYKELSTLDSRIPKNAGVCSEDCSDRAAGVAVCGEQATCQVMVAGKSPWPTSATYPIKTLDHDAMLAGVEFGAICRPLPASNAWSPKFGAQCTSHSDCDAGYKCVMSEVESKTVGECMAECVSTSGCPLFHSCNYATGEGFTVRVCEPVGTVAGACIDADGDGYGIGHCAVPSVDCNDKDIDIHYSTNIAGVCGESDINCNGIKDKEEHIGSNAHCSVCGDACTGGKVCINKQCVFDPNGIYCAPNSCRMNPLDDKDHQICDSSTSPALWKSCPSKYHMCEMVEGKAECVLNPEYNCEPGVCADGYTACNGGVRVDCDPEFEICSGNACVINTSGSKYNCTANTCFEDVDDFFCNSSQHPEKCPNGQRCQDGACISVVDSDALDMWKVCSDDSQCDYGKCLKSVTMAYNDALIVLSDLDPYDSIGTNMGVCTFDCTDNATICNLMTLGDGEPYSCQVIAHGSETDMTDKAQGIPFAAICRPTPDTDAGWSADFCANCEAMPCADGYTCDPKTKRCLAPCESDAHCPVFFACEDQMCKPMGTASCDKCIDMDKDGSGIGHCALEGFDCKDNDAAYYYTDAVRNADQASACANVDRNCNDVKDNTELLGTIYHCGGCGKVCGNPATDETNHIVSTCVSGNCVQKCEEGYAFTNGSTVAGGCTKIVEVQPAAVIPIDEVAKVYCSDADGDGYCVSDTTWDVWCLGNNVGNCYGYTLEGEKKVWGKKTKPSNYVALISSKKRDCNDTDPNINPGAQEECNGYDDDCNGEIDESSSLKPLGAECQSPPIQTNYIVVDSLKKDCRKNKFNGVKWGCLDYNFNDPLIPWCDNVDREYCADIITESCKENLVENAPVYNGPLDGTDETEYQNYLNKYVKNIQISCSAEIKSYGHYICARILDRTFQATHFNTNNYTLEENPYRYDVYCKTTPVKFGKLTTEYLDTKDNDRNGLEDDLFIQTYDPTEKKFVMVSEENAKDIKNMSELCTDDIHSTNSPNYGICQKAVFMPILSNNNNPLDAICVQNRPADFDFVDDPTDTNCDGFAGDLKRTLFVAAESQNYGAVVENVTDQRDWKDIYEYANHIDPITGLPDPLLQARPLASLEKAIKLARDCMNEYNGAGCSRICTKVSHMDGSRKVAIAPDLRDSYYCEDNASVNACISDPHCEVSLLPWDIVMTEGTFTHIDKSFNLNYPTEPGILVAKDGWQHYTLTDIKGHQRQNILPNNAVWRIHGGASLSHETWIVNKGTTTINMIYTPASFSKPEDISVFYANSSAKMHLLLSRVNVNAKAEGAVTESYLNDGRSPATIIGLKALNSGRVTLERSKITITAPSGANAPALPFVEEDDLDGRDASVITDVSKSNLFSHEVMAQWRRKHEPAAAKEGTLFDYKVCPDGSIVSAGGTGAVSPYTTQAWKQALAEAQDIFTGMGAGYYCPAESLEDWYIYNFANEIIRGKTDPYLYRKTGLSYDFTQGTSHTAFDAYQCALENQHRSDDSSFSIYDLFVAYASGKCFGPADGAVANKIQALQGGLAGQSKTFDKTVSKLEISGDNFNFRNGKVRSELSGGNGGNGLGGTGAPAFVMNNASAYSILKKIGPAGIYVKDAGAAFCPADENAYSRSIARSIAVSYLAAIRYGYAGAGALDDNGALILQGAGGGTGGCGGLGGEAGYPGGSAIGMILAHDVDIKIDDSSLVKVIAGSGGAGADGQDGATGGKGGKGLNYGQRTVISPFATDTNTYDDMALKTVHAQSGSGGGGGGAGADGKPGYGVGLLIDCSRFKTFAECNIRHNNSIRDLLKIRIETVPGKVRQAAISNATEGASAVSPTDALGTPTAIQPTISKGGKGGKHTGTATDYREIINGKITDVERVMSDEKLLYIYNENNVRVIGSNAQATQE